LKGVINFFAGTLRIGVPLVGIGEENPDREVLTTLENESRATVLSSFVGVKVTVLKREGVCRGFSVFLVADWLGSGDLKGFIKAFPANPEVDGVCNERLPGALGVEKCAADRKVPSPLA